MLSDPDNLRLQLVNTTHGLFDTIMPGGRVTAEPAALIPIGLDHIMLSVTDVDRSVAYYRKLFGPKSHVTAIRGVYGSNSRRFCSASRKRKTSETSQRCAAGRAPRARSWRGPRPSGPAARMERW